MNHSHLDVRVYYMCSGRVRASEREVPGSKAVRDFFLTKFLIFRSAIWSLLTRNPTINLCHQGMV
jgi:hypothetical protein